MSPNETVGSLPDGLQKDEHDVLKGLVYQGRLYPLDGTTEEDFDEVERFLMAQRKSPLLALKGQLDEIKDDPALQKAIMEMAYKDMRKHETVDVVSRLEIAQYMDTREGAVRTVWLMLRRVDPEITLAVAKKMLDSVSTSEALKMRDRASKKLIDKAKAIDAAARG